MFARVRMRAQCARTGLCLPFVFVEMPCLLHVACPQLLNIKTFFVKFLSAATAVGSGLPVGPEGPMIHMGAIVGAGLSQGHSTTLNIDSGLFRRFQVRRLLASRRGLGSGGGPASAGQGVLPSRGRVLGRSTPGDK